MLKRIATIVLIIILTVAFSGCQSIKAGLKRGWDSVTVSDTPLLEIQQRGPISNEGTTLPYDDYWYKYQDNYKPPKPKSSTPCKKK